MNCCSRRLQLKSLQEYENIFQMAFVWFAFREHLVCFGMCQFTASDRRGATESAA
jgi:hypothetical protein